jgi:hypothetical protein
MIWRIGIFLSSVAAASVYALSSIDVIQVPAVFSEFLKASVKYSASPEDKGIQKFKFDGVNGVDVVLGSVRISMRRASSEKGVFPIASIYEGSKRVAEMRLDELENENPRSQLSILRIDPDIPRSSIVFESFWGGAHCCTMSKIATFYDGQWKVTTGETLDGSGYAYTDIDDDGVFELVSFDNSFYYAFDSYAGSVAPSRISKLSDGRIVPITRESRFQRYLRDHLISIEEAARQQADLWTSNGFLAGWVASKSLVNEFDDAWPRMLKLYDQKSDWGLIRCKVAMVGHSCPAGQTYEVSFPQALQEHLIREGYLR